MTYSRSGGLFWAVSLIGVGIIFLLRNLGIVSGNIWGSLWPIFIIVLGLSMMFGGSRQGSRMRERRGSDWTQKPDETSSPQAVSTQDTKEFTQSIPLEGATEANVKIGFGGGHLRIASLSDPTMLLRGTSNDQVEQQVRRDGARLDVDLHQGPDWGPRLWNWTSGKAVDWSLDFNREIPLSLHLKTGASDSRINLSDLKIREVSLETGASKTEMTLPARGQASVNVQAGAAEIILHVPQSVAARIHISTGLASVKVDQSRFPSQGDVYQSSDYDTAENRVDIRISGGAASFEVR